MYAHFLTFDMIFETRFLRKKKTKARGYGNVYNMSPFCTRRYDWRSLNVNSFWFPDFVTRFLEKF